MSPDKHKTNNGCQYRIFNVLVSNTTESDNLHSTIVAAIRTNEITNQVGENETGWGWEGRDEGKEREMGCRVRGLWWREWERKSVRDNGREGE